MPNNFLDAFLQSRRDAMAQSQFDRELQARLDMAGQDLSFRKQLAADENARAARLDVLAREQFEANKQYNQTNSQVALANSRREGLALIAGGLADPGSLSVAPPTAPGVPSPTINIPAPDAVDLGGGVMGVPNSPEEIASRKAAIELRNRKAVAEAEFQQKAEDSKRYFPDNPKLQLQYQIYGPERMDPANLQQALTRELSSGGDTTKIMGLLRALAAAERSPGQEAASFAAADANRAQADLYRNRVQVEKDTQEAQGVLRDAMATVLPKVGNDKNKPELHGLVVGLIDARVKDGTIPASVGNRAIDLLDLQRQSSGNAFQAFMMNQMLGGMGGQTK